MDQRIWAVAKRPEIRIGALAARFIAQWKRYCSGRVSMVPGIRWRPTVANTR
jgi:hypothetical protein